ncbi:MAG: L-threonylcarbamoyladenylate synthase [Candidatus Omnitrophota bacterium]
MTQTPVLSAELESAPEVVRKAAKFLREGKLVAFPTETVYGLGVSMDHPDAVERLYRVKGRPKEKELTLAIAGFSDLKKYGVILEPAAETFAKRFWPGPLTLLLKNRGGETIGVRMPGHPVARAILSEAGVAVGLPSANPSGKTPPRSAEEVLTYFDGVIDLIVDGGKTALGISSTVVDLTGPAWKIVREGVITTEEIRRAWPG